MLNIITFKMLYKLPGFVPISECSSCLVGIRGSNVWKKTHKTTPNIATRDA